MDLLIFIAVLALIFGVVIWCLSMIPLPEPYGRIVQVVVALIFLLVLLQRVLPYAGVRL
jgi:hypothetical protein